MPELTPKSRRLTLKSGLARAIIVGVSVTGTLLVFDLDGTLIDSRHDLAASTNEMLTSYGARPLRDDEVTAMVGEGARVLVERALAAASLDVDAGTALDRFLTIYDRRLLDETRPYEGITDLLAWAAVRAPVAVLTNKPTRHTTRLLEALELARHIRWAIGGDAPFARKPDPAGLRHLIGEAGAAPTRTLMVGDSMVDVETGRRAGTRVCAAAYGFGHLRAPLTLLDGEWRADRVEDVRVAVEAVTERPRR